jgi:hypothetical protein
MARLPLRAGMAIVAMLGVAQEGRTRSSRRRRWAASAASTTFRRTPPDGDGEGHVYAVLQDKENIAVIDAKTMKVTAHYGFAGKGARWNGLVLDAKNHVLFAACGQSGNPPEPKPAMVILDAGDAKILTTLPLAGSSGGAVFNPKTMEAFSTHAGAKCLTLDTKTDHILTMAAEYGPAPTPTPDAQPGRGGPGARGPMLADSFTILVIGNSGYCIDSAEQPSSCIATRRISSDSFICPRRE